MKTLYKSILDVDWDIDDEDVKRAHDEIVYGHWKIFDPNYWVGNKGLFKNLFEFIKKNGKPLRPGLGVRLAKLKGKPVVVVTDMNVRTDKYIYVYFKENGQYACLNFECGSDYKNYKKSPKPRNQVGAWYTHNGFNLDWPSGVTYYELSDKHLEEIRNLLK